MATKKEELTGIYRKYRHLSKIPSDINEHLPILYRHAIECNHITEMGAGKGVSTWAFLASTPGRMIAYDICFYPKVNEIIKITKNACLDFTFIQANVLEVEIEQTDLLFIDTFHHPLQLQREFDKHSDKVNKYIILHDTELHKNINEVFWPDVRKEFNKRGISTNEFDIYKNIGIFPVVIDFLNNNKEWSIKEILLNNNGLTILEKNI